MQQSQRCRVVSQLPGRLGHSPACQTCSSSQADVGQMLAAYQLGSHIRQANGPAYFCEDQL